MLESAGQLKACADNMVRQALGFPAWPLSSLMVAQTHLMHYVYKGQTVSLLLLLMAKFLKVRPAAYRQAFSASDLSLTLYEMLGTAAALLLFLAKTGPGTMVCFLSRFSFSSCGRCIRPE